MVNKIILSVFLTLVVLSTSIYVMMPDKVKIVVEETRTKLYVYEDSWDLIGTEYFYIWEGSTKLRAKSREVTYGTDDSITQIVRWAYYKDNISTQQVYTFDSTIDDVRFVPVKHEAYCYNCVGKIVHFEYRNIEYNGVTKDVTSPQQFGKLKIEWQDGYYRAKVYQQKVASDKLIIRYRPQSNKELYLIRMVDPPQFNAPVVNINSPVNGYNATSQLSANFDYYDLDGDAASCTLMINGTINSTNSSVPNGSLGVIITSTGLTEVGWEWFMNCTSGDNSTNSSIRIFNFDTGTFNISSYTACGNVSNFTFYPNLTADSTVISVLNISNQSYIVLTSYNSSLVNQTEDCAFNLTNNNSRIEYAIDLCFNVTYATNRVKCGSSLDTSVNVSTCDFPANVLNVSAKSNGYLKCWADYINANETKYHVENLTWRAIT